MDARSVIDRYYDLFNRHDAAALALLFQEQGTFDDPATRAPLDVGRATEFTNRWFVAFPDRRLAATTVAGGGVCSAIEWSFTGTNTGALRPGLAPMGRSVTLTGVDVFRITDGRISRLCRYYDQQRLAETTGLQVVDERVEADPHESHMDPLPELFGAERRLRRSSQPCTVRAGTAAPSEHLVTLSLCLRSGRGAACQA